MSISSSLNAGVSGLAANATRLSTIADNISNSSTFGYKRVTTDFEGMVINQARGAGVYSAGGVRASTSRLVDERGTLISTSHPLDLAISGRGMLPVAPSVSVGDMGKQPMMMTTTGAFRPDADGVLRTDSGLVLLGWPANADGTIPVMPRDTLGGLQPVIINANQTAADPTTKMTLGVNLPATATDYGEPGDAIPTSIEYFGNLGTSELLSVTFTPTVSGVAGTGTNTWTVEIRDSATPNDPATTADESLIGRYEVAFSDGKTGGGTIVSVTPAPGFPAYDSTTGAISLPVLEGKGSIDITLGRPGDQNGMTQLSDTFQQTNITKDGSPVGNLTAVEVDENGYIRATYDTGFIRTVYQIPLVDVPNPNGLTSLNNQTFQVSPTSGSFFLWDAGDGPTGSVVGYAREGSTTDVAAELTSLIQTQRAYSSNAKVIQTVDEMLQETTNIKR
ncbi:flagellar hook protein FlgE [Paracoccus pacificus]|uniref:Flagellar hook protein FlgE n=1 Tax=Paracoccus pacificus TaxID=1463598 RepID=A0ABW4R3P0_9RHOB